MMERLKKRSLGFGIAVIVLLLLVNVEHIQFYLLLDNNFYLALALAPFIIAIDRTRPGRQLYAFLSLAALLAWYLMGVQTLFFLGLMFGIFYLVEQHIGRLNRASFVLLLLCSPLATYLFKVFGFPIRLSLTEIATRILATIGMDAASAGNTIQMNGDEFTVEPACTGLKLVITGLLITLVLIRRVEKNKYTTVKLPKLFMLLAIAFLLIVLSNLIRIIGLVLFKAPADSFSHEFIGLFSLAVYTILPLMVLVPKLIPKNDPNTLKPAVVSWYSLALQFCVVSALLFHNHSISTSTTTHAQLAQEMTINGYHQRDASFDGFKFTKEGALLYVKPCLDFWRADHNPIICWRGSGYQFSHEKIEKVDGRSVYTARLNKGKDELYTAWWFQNENDQTISQVGWRWEMAKGEAPYNLINVSCNGKAQLIKEVQDLMGKNKLISHQHRLLHRSGESILTAL